MPEDNFFYTLMVIVTWAQINYPQDNENDFEDFF